MSKNGIPTHIPSCALRLPRPTLTGTRRYPIESRIDPIGFISWECYVPNAHCVFIDLQIEFRTKAYDRGRGPGRAVPLQSHSVLSREGACVEVDGLSGTLAYKIVAKRQKGLVLPTCFFATDLHGKIDRYDKLLTSIIRHRPTAVFLGGDLLPPSVLGVMQFGHEDFVQDYLVPAFTRGRNFATATTIPTSSSSSVTTTHVVVRKTSLRPEPMASGTTPTNRKVSWGTSPSMALPTFHRPHFC